MSKKAKAAADIRPTGNYRVILSRTVQTPAMTYRPGVEHKMTGKGLIRLLAAANVDPADAPEVCSFESVDAA
jgi:hypothetical protein